MFLFHIRFKLRKITRPPMHGFGKIPFLYSYNNVL